MQITNEILLSFLNCPYKAYRKWNSENGKLSDFEKLSAELTKSQKVLFAEKLSTENKLIRSSLTDTDFKVTNGVIVNQKFSNTNVELLLDGIELVDKNRIIPILITPFEKISKTDKLLLSLQATYLQAEFHFQIEHCKIVYGKNLKETKFRLTTFSKVTKKSTGELNKILNQSNSPVFHRVTHCQICEFQNSCLEKLKERDDLSLLAGLKPKEVLQKNNRGLFSVKQLSFTFKPKKNPYRKRKFLPELKALAIREEKTFIQEIPVLKEVATELFIDFEGIIDRGSNYLIGVILKTKDGETNYSFWADDSTEEENIFIQLFELLKSFDDYIVYHYGSYEILALQKIAKRIPEEYKVVLDKIIENSYNLLNIFTHYVYPPTYSNSLKEIARFIKFEWTEKDASGIQSTVWRYKWEVSRDKDLKHKIIKYNIEDCEALIKVKDWLVKMPTCDKSVFDKVENIKRDSIFKWQKNNFIINEFNQINNFAYFNYQREKVLIRTYPKIISNKKRKKAKKKLIPNKILSNPNPQICPRCSGNRFHKHDISNRTIIDLKISNTGIKREVILYHVFRFKCVECLYVFAPTDTVSFHSKYGRTLSCWIINQSIFYRNSFNHISLQLKESFDINILPSVVNNFKIKFCENYKFTFDEIVKQIISSNLIHVDETTFHVRNESLSYVWVFTNIDTVFYLYRQTRESEFLNELLIDFKGVLISDFYAGYDALNCPKQRCLIHLIRDLNDDLVKNQLDLEFKIIVQNFAFLLDSIVTTINKYGLKKRNLNKHKKVVNCFFQSLETQDFESEICRRWQKRFNTFKEELFTFLNYDGIPWNNNNAEAAIKAIALYRREADGLATKNRIQETLTLLSIEQTCKFRGINFFEFLKSGEMSISEFSKK